MILKKRYYNHIKNKWNKNAIEADNEFLAEQEKIEPVEATETPAN